MDEHEKVLKDFGRQLGEFLNILFVSEAGLPRPIISLEGDMPILLPINQDTLHDFSQFVTDHKRDFHPATLVFHVQPYKDPYHRKTIPVEFPYTPLASGEPFQRLDDPRPVKLSRIVVPRVPPEWRELRMKPLEVLVQAQARHTRHGVALGVGPVIPYRVPRQEIPGKATGL